MQSDDFSSVVSIRESNIGNNAIANQTDPFVHGAIMLMQLIEELDLVSAGSKGVIKQGGCLGIVFGS